jgi:hypothetical protein
MHVSKAVLKTPVEVNLANFIKNFHRIASRRAISNPAFSSMIKVAIQINVLESVGGKGSTPMLNSIGTSSAAVAAAIKETIAVSMVNTEKL